MSASSMMQDSDSKCFANDTAATESGTSQTLTQALKDIYATVPPLWPLNDYVAVNAFFGLADRSFLAARQTLRDVRECDLLMPLDYFRSLYQTGKLSHDRVSAAHAQCVADNEQWFAKLGLAELFELLQGRTDKTDADRERFRTVAEVIDADLGSTWTSHILNDITRHCSTHYDQGHALWNNPWKAETLYTAWQQAAKLSHRLNLLGLSGFRKFVAELPANPYDAIQQLMTCLDVPQSRWGQFLLCEAFSVAGWASYVRYQVKQSEFANQQNDDLVGLLAIRLAYDVALARKHAVRCPLKLWPRDSDNNKTEAVTSFTEKELLARYVLQVAAEQTYQHELFTKLSSRRTVEPGNKRPSLQMAFCIDVRSEVMRRNLESVDDSIETLGFAGSFGIPLEYVSFGTEIGTPQCPAIVHPNVHVHESLPGQSDAAIKIFERKRQRVRRSRKLWKLFQSSSASCFSFVESIGLGYVGKLLSDSLRWSRPVESAGNDGLPEDLVGELGPDIGNPHNHGLTKERQIDLAEAILRNLGLTTGFARVVAFCGHAADVTNNHYRAALNCGACGGHSGKPNARVAAALFNNVDVRKGLSQRGIAIPDETWFLAAVHLTTTDVVEICDLHLVPASHIKDIEPIRQSLEKASFLCGLERAARLQPAQIDDAFRRSRDWAEVRPELGLASNAAFIVAPRTRTKGIDLGGRTFLHNYDHRSDSDLKVLESIMTAPMVVTNWINMQYYASSVDPVAFGSGNKVIHNVVGQFGVLQGNGGDLMTGLPWQSVHDGKQLLHEPLRLLVVIDALRSSVETIIQKHPMVRDLVTNGWMLLTVWEGTEFYRWSANQTWEPGSL